MKVHLTDAEREALLAAARCGQYEYTDVVRHDPDASPQLRAARLAALDRALTKLAETRR